MRIRFENKQQIIAVAIHQAPPPQLLSANRSPLASKLIASSSLGPGLNMRRNVTCKRSHTEWLRT